MNMKENQSRVDVREPGGSPVFSPIELDPSMTISLTMQKIARRCDGTRETRNQTEIRTVAWTRLPER
jgi:hypothetical protein